MTTTVARLPISTEQHGPPPQESAALRERISRLERACGCRPAAVAGSGVLSLYLAATTYVGPWAAWGPVVATGLLLSTIALLTGKAWGLRRAGAERDRLLRDLATAVRSERPTVAPGGRP